MMKNSIIKNGPMETFKDNIFNNRSKFYKDKIKNYCVKIKNRRKEEMDLKKEF